MNFHRPTDTQNRRLYNGKELQTELGIDFYEYGARNYDAQLGRWHSIDPLAEDYFWLSPYDFVGGNPVIRIDPNGMGWDTDYFDIYGNFLRSDNIDNGIIYIEYSVNGATNWAAPSAACLTSSAYSNIFTYYYAKKFGEEATSELYKGKIHAEYLDDAIGMVSLNDEGK